MRAQLAASRTTCDASLNLGVTELSNVGSPLFPIAINTLRTNLSLPIRLIEVLEKCDPAKKGVE